MHVLEKTRERERERKKSPIIFINRVTDAAVQSLGCVSCRQLELSSPYHCVREKEKKR